MPQESVGVHRPSGLFISTLFSILSISTTRGEKLRGTSAELVAQTPGDITLGGLFPVHTSGVTMCNAINPERGIQRVEAMLFTIDEINNNTSLLPGLQLGAVIRDTCSASNYGLEQALRFVQGNGDTSGTANSCGAPEQWKNLKQEAGKDRPMARGVVGSSYSSVSILVANLFRLFALPQISYASTSAVLSDKRTFPLFARTVPSDVVQARAMATLVSAHNWTYVSTVRSAGDYGDSGMDAFWREADKLGVCIAAREIIRSNTGTKDLDAIVRVLRYDFAKARVVVLFTGMDHTKLLLDAVRRAGLVDHFVWIASDGWGRENLPVSNNSRVANGALTIEIQAKPVLAFTDHYLNLTYENSRNPWFREYWEDLFGCSFDKPNESGTRGASVVNSTQTLLKHTRLACDLNPHQRLRDRLGTDFKQEAKIQFIYDAVYAFAHGLHKLQEKLCPGNPYHPNWNKNVCVEKLLAYPGTDFYQTILGTSFTDKYGNYVAFDENGDGYGQYSIYNYARHPYTGQYNYRLVGDYQGGKLTMRARPIWPAGQSSEVPISQCSEECGFAEIRRLDKKQQCCWSCEPCADNQRVVNVTHCETCAFRQWPTQDRTGCELLELHYIDISTWFAIVPMTFSGVGICVTIGVIATWRIYSETPIVRATGRELAYVQLSGCLVCFLVPFILLARPSVFTCSMQRILIGLGFAMMYASLLTKTNRIARIFDAAKHTTRRPVYISPRSQLVIAGALITLQLALSAIWFGFDAPDTRIDPIRSDYLVLRCAMKDKSFLISLAYNVVLIIVCTAYAVKTRRIPENFNESKFIGFTMYTTCIIWLAFLPMYYATMNNFEIQIATLCISISLSASVMLSCLFLPKLYIIYFQPEKNVRRLNMSNRSAKLKLPVVSQPAYLNTIMKQPNDASHLDSAGTSVTTTAAPTSTSLTLTSSTHAEEQFGNLEGSTEIQAPSPTVMNPRPPGRRPSLNVISNPIALSLEMKSNSTQQQRPSFTEILPNRSQLQPLQNGMQQFPNEFLTPTPISLDTIAQQSMLTPPYCDEPTSAEEDEFYPGRRALVCDCGASSSSQILSNLCTTLHSISNSSYSGQTPHSSDFYLHSCGEDTQVALSTTSTSSSVESEMVFRQLRQSKEAKSRMDNTKQTVTAL